MQVHGRYHSHDIHSFQPNQDCVGKAEVDEWLFVHHWRFRPINSPFLAICTSFGAVSEPFSIYISV